MICISIAQESRRFALVDMHNAAPQCDLLEVRLDRFGKSPEIGELLAAKPKPVILSCRRQQDGGDWEGSEDERLAILRQCIISKADYVEIELDAADQVRPFPGSKRVISYYNLNETPSDLADVYAECQKKKPDVIKLVTRAGTPEEAWPLVQILARPAVPTVVVGVGKPGVMLTVWGRKMESPWAYAALERGMEAYPDQPTVSDLETVYHYKAIGRATKLVGVTGFSDRARATVALVNAAFAHLGQNTRCLPLEVGSVRLFRKVLEAVKMPSALIDEEHGSAVAEVAAHLQGAAQTTRAVDVLASQSDGWHGFHLHDRSVVAALESVLRARGSSLDGRTVMLVGISDVTKVLGQRIAKYGGILVVASRDRERARSLAQDLHCRQVQYEAVYTTLHDVLVLCSDEADVAPQAGRGREIGIHTGYLKPGMTVVDLTAGLTGSDLLREAKRRGCGVVEPRQVLLDGVLQQVKLIAGKEVPRELLQPVLDTLLPPDE